MTGDDPVISTFRERRVIGKGGHCRQLVQQRTRRCSPSRDEIMAGTVLNPEPNWLKLLAPSLMSLKQDL